MPTRRSTSPAPADLPTRRGLLRGAAVLGVTAATAALTASPADASGGTTRWTTRGRTPLAGTARPAPPVAGPVSPAVSVGLVSDPLLHLLRRTTFGLTPALVAEARRTGGAAWLEQQLAPGTIDDSACDAVVSRFPSIPRTAKQIRTLTPGDGTWEAAQELVRATLVRAAWSKRQLLEVMVEFWSNHLNVTTPSDGVNEWRPQEDRDVIRRHALGRFSDMLVASGTSPAMLRYLNNASSKATNPNENYGRELLELHTVGVAAGYTERDVKGSALMLTGFTVDDVSLEFRYRPDWHHVGPLQVLGFRHDNATAAGGLEAGKAYLRYLASHPATAKRLAHKLCVRFVSDTPPPALVARLADTYLRSDTAIAPVLRELFSSPEFAASVGAKTRRPLEELVAVVRILGIGPDPDGGVDGITDLHWGSLGRGQVPFGWSTPDGYPDVAAAWSSTASVRAAWVDHLRLAAGWWPRQLEVCRVKELLGGRTPATAGELVDVLSQRLLFQVLPPLQRQAVLSFVGVPADAAPPAPLVTYDLPYVVAMILDTPAWSAR